MRKCAIIGASGAIGGAFVNQLSSRADTACVFAFSRSETRFDAPTIHSGFIDLTDEGSIQSAAKQASADGLLDVVIVASGLLHHEDLLPEKSLKDCSASKLEELFAINTIGPLLVMKHFLPILHKDHPSVFAALSARVGSIADNHLGGWYSYRASKAALNMLIKTASIEIARVNRQAIVIGLHPGTVDSKLSKLFQRNVTPDHLFSPDYAAAHLLTVIDQLHPEDTGKCFAYDGIEITP